MESILRGYTFRMYPNEEWQMLIEKSFGCGGYIYNYFLEKNKDKKYINAFDEVKDLPNLSKEKV